MISNKAPSMNEGAFPVFTMQRKSNDATENSNSGRTFQLWQNFPTVAELSNCGRTFTSLAILNF